MNKTNNEALTSKQTSNVAQSSQGSSYFPGSIYFDHNWGVIFTTDLWLLKSKFHLKFYLKIRPNKWTAKKMAVFVIKINIKIINQTPSSFIHCFSCLAASWLATWPGSSLPPSLLQGGDDDDDDDGEDGDDDDDDEDFIYMILFPSTILLCLI